MWLVNTGNGKAKGVFAGTAARKLTNAPAVILSYPCRNRWFIFTKQIIIVLLWVIIYSYFQKFFKIGVLKNFLEFTGKHLCRSFFLISQEQVACYFLNMRLWHRCFLVNFVKLSRTPFLQTTLRLLLLYLLNISVISPNLLFFQPFETLIIIEIYTCEIKIRRTWEFILLLHFWFYKFVIKFD